MKNLIGKMSILLCLSNYYCYAQSLYSLNGKIIDESGFSLAQVFIINLNTQKKGESKEDGTFSIEARQNNKIQILMLGYKTQTLKMDTAIAFATVVLQKNIIKIDTVVFGKWPDYNKLKYQLEHMEIKEERPVDLKVNKNFNSGYVGMPLPSDVIHPISYFYHTFSKRGKQEVRNNNFKIWESSMDYFHSYIRSSVPIADNEIIDFEIFCDFPEKYLLDHKYNYEPLRQQIFQCWKEYEEEKLKNKK